MAGVAADSVLYQLAEKAQAEEATAVLLYSRSAPGKLPEFRTPAAFPALSIPVAYVSQPAAERFFADQTASVSIEMRVAFSIDKDTSYRLVGWVDHHAASTLVLAAGDAGSQAALLELVRLLSQGKSYANQNYRVIAFYGTDTLGQSTQPSPANGIFYLEGLAHLDATAPVLTIAGIPPAAKWSEAFDRARSKTLVIRKAGPAESPETSVSTMPVVHIRGRWQGPDNFSAETSAIRYLTDLIGELNH